MINNILSAYEEMRRQNEDPFFKALKHVGIGVQIYFIFFLICGFTMIITLVLNQIKIFLCILIAILLYLQYGLH